MTTIDAPTTRYLAAEKDWFGLAPPWDKALWAYGARAIYHTPRTVGNRTARTADIDIPFDRGQFAWGLVSDARTRKALAKRVDKLIAKLRRECARVWLGGDSHDTVRLTDGELVLEASPRASYGYLYLVVYPLRAA